MTQYWQVLLKTAKKLWKWGCWSAELFPGFAPAAVLQSQVTVHPPPLFKPNSTGQYCYLIPIIPVTALLGLSNRWCPWHLGKPPKKKGYFSDFVLNNGWVGVKSKVLNILVKTHIQLFVLQTPRNIMKHIIHKWGGHIWPFHDNLTHQFFLLWQTDRFFFRTLS